VRNALQDTSLQSRITTVYGNANFGLQSWAPGIVGGADLAVAVAKHVSVVPQVRLTWVRRSDDPSQPMWLLGLDSFVWRGAVGLRASF